ncbi:unnamed protein product [Rhizophagus irregularis]|nr:unnamed protein product [Rhizophagus irregularis]
MKGPHDSPEFAKAGTLLGTVQSEKAFEGIFYEIRVNIRKFSARLRSTENSTWNHHGNLQVKPIFSEYPVTNHVEWIHRVQDRST